MMLKLWLVNECLGWNPKNFTVFLLVAHHAFMARRSDVSSKTTNENVFIICVGHAISKTAEAT